MTAVSLAEWTQHREAGAPAFAVGPHGPRIFREPMVMLRAYGPDELLAGHERPLLLMDAGDAGHVAALLALLGHAELAELVRRAGASRRGGEVTMFTLIRTKTLAALRERQATADATLRARALALEVASFLTGDYPKPDQIPYEARKLSEWIGHPSADDFEARMTAVTRLLADLASHRNHIYNTYEFTSAADNYHLMLTAPMSDTRPAAALSTAQLRDGADHQNAGAIR